jgi:nucleoid-associated protein YgaU
LEQGNILFKKAIFSPRSPAARWAANELGEIYEANKDIIGDNKNLIYPYTVLRLPQ